MIDASVPVVWDRFTELDGFFVVFGWLERPDGQRDFLLFEMQEGCPIGDVFYTTSSAKYSRSISMILYGADEDHNDCQRIADLLSRYEGTVQ